MAQICQTFEDFLWPRTWGAAKTLLKPHKCGTFEQLHPIGEEGRALVPAEIIRTD